MDKTKEVEELVKAIRKCGQYWDITAQDAGRELFVVPMGKKAFDIIANELIKQGWGKSQPTECKHDFCSSDYMGYRTCIKCGYAK